MDLWPSEFTLHLPFSPCSVETSSNMMDIMCDDIPYCGYDDISFLEDVTNLINPLPIAQNAHPNVHSINAPNNCRECKTESSNKSMVDSLRPGYTRVQRPVKVTSQSATNVYRVEPKKARQRGYEKAYRGRKKESNDCIKEGWLQLEKEVLYKLCQLKRGYVKYKSGLLKSDVDINAAQNAILETYALQIDNFAMMYILSHFKAMTFWGLKSQTRQTLNTELDSKNLRLNFTFTW